MDLIGDSKPTGKTDAFSKSLEYKILNARRAITIKFIYQQNNSQVTLSLFRNGTKASEQRLSKVSRIPNYPREDVVG